MKGFVTMGDDQCGVEGPAAAMPPDVSREMKTVCGNASASVRPLLSYFSFARILDEIIKARLKGRDTCGLLPPRKLWSRGGVRERPAARGPASAGCGGEPRRHAKRSPEDIRRESILRRVMKCRKDGTLAGQNWGARLLGFVAEIQTKVRNGGVRFGSPRMIQIAKGVKDGRTEYRTVASFDRLEDRVVLNLMTACLRDRLERVLSPSCYSFRRDGRISHETAVVELQRWRARHEGGTMSVGECDIRKFFDSIPHETVRRCWRELKERMALEDSALAIVEAYLASYSAGGVGHTALPGNGAVGLPQGGSLSTVLANLVLSEADSRVLQCDDGDLFYARYCDDVVFAHANEAKCREAMEVYEAALMELGLPMHERRGFTYRPSTVTGEPTYYEIKTKGPFRWAKPEIDEPDVAPWVSFVGSQIRFDGETRIRRESVKRHARALGRVTAAAVREIERWDEESKSAGEVFAWYSRFRNLLIAKGVGYVTAKMRDCDHCWAAAFEMAMEKRCGETQKEMRYLDRIREKMLSKVAKLLRERGFEVVKGHRYKGKPFSYHAFLMKAVERPTSMRGKPRRRRLLYSML